MTALITYLQAHPVIIVALLAVLFVVVTSLLSWKFGFKWINIANSVTNFIADSLSNLGVSNANFELVLQLITQAVAHVVKANSALTIDEKVKESIDFIVYASSAFKVTLSEADIAIISTVLKFTYLFIEANGFKPQSLQAENLLRGNARFLAKLPKVEH